MAELDFEDSLVLLRALLLPFFLPFLRTLLSALNRTDIFPGALNEAVPDDIGSLVLSITMPETAATHTEQETRLAGTFKHDSLVVGRYSP